MLQVRGMQTADEIDHEVTMQVPQLTAVKLFGECRLADLGRTCVRAQDLGQSVHIGAQLGDPEMPDPDGTRRHLPAMHLRQAA